MKARPVTESEPAASKRRSRIKWDRPDEEKSVHEFTDEQLRALVDSLRLDSLGIDVGAAEIQLVRWAHQAYVAGGLLDLLLERKIAVVGFEGSEPLFCALDGMVVEGRTTEVWLSEPEERPDDRN